MRRLTVSTIVSLVLALWAIAPLPAAPTRAELPPAVQPPAPSAPSIDLAARLAGGTLRSVNRDVTRLDGMPGCVHVSERRDWASSGLTGVISGKARSR